MLVLNVTESLTKKWPIIGLMVFGTFLISVDSPAGELNGQTMGSCFFSQQLQAPDVRAAYVERLAYLDRRSAAQSGDVESMYRNVIKAGYKTRQVIGLDSLSFECVTCHDGSSFSCHIK